MILVVLVTTVPIAVVLLMNQLTLVDMILAMQTHHLQFGLVPQVTNSYGRSMV